MAASSTVHSSIAITFYGWSCVQRAGLQLGSRASGCRGFVPGLGWWWFCLPSGVLHKQDESLAWVLVDVELKSPFKQCLILAFFSAMLSCIIIELALQIIAGKLQVTAALVCRALLD